MRSHEISKLLGIPVSTLHYYEKAGLLTPTRNENGYRIYQQNDVETMKFVLFLKEMKFTLPEIRTILSQFSRLNAYKDLAEYGEATAFFAEKKRQFQQSIERYQLAIEMIDLIFEKHFEHPSADNALENKEAIIRRIYQLTERFWQVKLESTPLNKENFFE
ncbi:hypothetical protein BAU15_07785 [Enterococcus sp. JM4C]|uniref:MerR family transcriptional regulator n=1 Tax=Candidatus Enterococcus huntleyi TaxID=1857217 RepID=UPI00137A53FE|nr:MerR family transcriptional regulator [Enterococcus sp. JM4C]KAF1297603.1 hypothetical protein BAU15_07785 [Enterococcus sp. JM4C]